MQEKAWERICKAIAYVLIFTFILYDITWAQGGTPQSRGGLNLPYSVDNSGESGWQHARPDVKLNGKPTLNGIKVPYEAGRVEEAYDAEANLSKSDFHNYKLWKSDFIVNIQDAHASLEAQYSIVKILENLSRNYDLDLIALEGAEGPIDISLLKTFPDPEIRKETASYLMRKGKMSAGEFFSVISDKPIKLYGIEDNSLYKENVDALKLVMEKKLECIKRVDNLINTLAPLEDKIYTEDLKNLNQNTILHENGNLAFTKHWDYIDKLAKRNNIELVIFENLNKLLKTIALEKEIDFSNANNERKLLIDDLSKTLPKIELEKLVLESVSFKTEKISQASFHNYLVRLAEDAKLDPTPYPNLIKFTNYITIYEDIDLTSLFREVEDLEDYIREKIYRNDEERTLYNLTKAALTLKKLFEATLTNEDYGFLITKKRYFDKAIFQDFIRRMYEKSDFHNSNNSKLWKSDFNNYDLDKILGPNMDEAINFYNIAQRRNNIMLQNTIKAMRENNEELAALITGGFHSKGLKDLMKENNLSYLIIMPRMKEGDTRPYIAVLTNKRQPYEELLATGQYILAMRAYFHTGDPRDMLELVYHALGTAELKGEPLLPIKQDWYSRFKKAYAEFGEVTATTWQGKKRPITPQEFSQMLGLDINGNPLPQEGKAKQGIFAESVQVGSDKVIVIRQYKDGEPTIELALMKDEQGNYNLDLVPPEVKRTLNKRQKQEIGGKVRDDTFWGGLPAGGLPEEAAREEAAPEIKPGDNLISVKGSGRGVVRVVEKVMEIKKMDPEELKKAGKDIENIDGLAPDTKIVKAICHYRTGKTTAATRYIRLDSLLKSLSNSVICILRKGDVIDIKDVNDELGRARVLEVDGGARNIKFKLTWARDARDAQFIGREAQVSTIELAEHLESGNWRIARERKEKSIAKRAVKPPRIIVIPPTEFHTQKSTLGTILEEIGVIRNAEAPMWEITDAMRSGKIHVVITIDRDSDTLDAVMGLQNLAASAVIVLKGKDSSKTGETQDWFEKLPQVTTLEGISFGSYGFTLRDGTLIDMSGIEGDEHKTRSSTAVYDVNITRLEYGGRQLKLGLVNTLLKYDFIELRIEKGEWIPYLSISAVPGLETPLAQCAMEQVSAKKEPADVQIMLEEISRLSKLGLGAIGTIIRIIQSDSHPKVVDSARRALADLRAKADRLGAIKSFAIMALIALFAVILYFLPAIAPFLLIVGVVVWWSPSRPWQIKEDAPLLVGKTMVSISMEGNRHEFEGHPAQDVNTKGGLGAYYGDKLDPYDDAAFEGMSVIGIQPGYAGGVEEKNIDYDELVRQGLLEEISFKEDIKIWSWAEDPVLGELVRSGDKEWIVQRQNGNVETRIKVYKIKRDKTRRGADKYILAHPVWDTLYSEDRIHRFTQEIMFGKAVHQLLRKLDIAPDILHLNEGHTVVAAAEMRAGKDNFFEKTAIVLTDHTPKESGHEMFYPTAQADINRMTYVLGPGGERFRSQFLRRRKGELVVDFSVAAIELADVINAVSEEHARVTKGLFERIYKEKTGKTIDLNIIPVLNGSGDSWVAKKLLMLRKNEKIPAEDELYQIHEESKINEAYEEVYKRTGIRLDPEKPAAWAVRRITEYKSQYPILRFLAHLMCADRNTVFTKESLNKIWDEEILPFLGDEKEKARPYNAKLDETKESIMELLFKEKTAINGLGMQMVVGGAELEPHWVNEFKRWAGLPALKGKFVYVPNSDVRLLKMQAVGADICITMPRPLEEASGTSDQRTALNGGVNIAILGAGPVEWMTDYHKNTRKGSGFFIGSYTEEIEGELQADTDAFYKNAPRDILEKLAVASELFYDNKAEWKRLMHNSYMASTHGSAGKKAVTAMVMEERYAADVYVPALEKRERDIRAKSSGLPVGPMMMAFTVPPIIKRLFGLFPFRLNFARESRFSGSGKGPDATPDTATGSDKVGCPIEDWEAVARIFNIEIESEVDPKHIINIIATQSMTAGDSSGNFDWNDAGRILTPEQEKMLSLEIKRGNKAASEAIYFAFLNYVFLWSEADGIISVNDTSGRWYLDSGDLRDLGMKSLETASLHFDAEQGRFGKYLNRDLWGEKKHAEKAARKRKNHEEKAGHVQGAVAPFEEGIFVNDVDKTVELLKSVFATIRERIYCEAYDYAGLVKKYSPEKAEISANSAVRIAGASYSDEYIVHEHLFGGKDLKSSKPFKQIGRKGIPIVKQKGEKGELEPDSGIRKTVSKEAVQARFARSMNLLSSYLEAREVRDVLKGEMTADLLRKHLARAMRSYRPPRRTAIASKPEAKAAGIPPVFALAIPFVIFMAWFGRYFIRHQKGGVLSFKEKRYKAKLIRLLKRHPAIRDYAEIAANSLLRYNRKSLEGFAKKGILTDEEIDLLSERKLFNINGLAGRIESILDGYRKSGMTEINQRQLLSHFFTIEEINSLKKSFPDLKESYIIRACLHDPEHTKEFLEDAVKKEAEIREEPEFADLPDWAIRRASFHHPRETRKFLRDALRIAARIEGEKGFSALSRHSIIRACIYEPKNPRKFLRGVKRRYKKLRKNPEFASLPNWAIEHTALNYPKTSERFLRETIRKCNEIKKEDEFRNIPDSDVLYACVHDPNEPRELLRDLIKVKNEIKKEPEFKDISDVVVFKGWIHYRKRFKQYLRLHRSRTQKKTRPLRQGAPPSKLAKRINFPTGIPPELTERLRKVQEEIEKLKPLIIAAFGMGSVVGYAVTGNPAFLVGAVGMAAQFAGSSQPPSEGPQRIKWKLLDVICDGLKEAKEAVLSSEEERCFAIFNKEPSIGELQSLPEASNLRLGVVKKEFGSWFLVKGGEEEISYPEMLWHRVEFRLHAHLTYPHYTEEDKGRAVKLGTEYVLSPRGIWGYGASFDKPIFVAWEELRPIKDNPAAKLHAYFTKRAREAREDEAIVINPRDWLSNSCIPEVMYIEKNGMIIIGERKWSSRNYELMPRPNLVGIVARHKGRIVGFVVYAVDKRKDWIGLVRLGVHPDYIGHDVEKLLIEKLKSKIIEGRWIEDGINEYVSGVCDVVPAGKAERKLLPIQLQLEKPTEFPYYALPFVFNVIAKIKDRIRHTITKPLVTLGILIKSVATKATNSILKLSLNISESKSNLSWVKKFFFSTKHTLTHVNNFVKEVYPTTPGLMLSKVQEDIEKLKPLIIVAFGMGGVIGYAVTGNPAFLLGTVGMAWSRYYRQTVLPNEAMAKSRHEKIRDLHQRTLHLALERFSGRDVSRKISALKRRIRASGITRSDEIIGFIDRKNELIALSILGRLLRECAETRDELLKERNKRQKTRQKAQEEKDGQITLWMGRLREKSGATVVEQKPESRRLYRWHRILDAIFKSLAEDYRSMKNLAETLEKMGNELDSFVDREKGLSQPEAFMQRIEQLITSLERVRLEEKTECRRELEIAQDFIRAEKLDYALASLRASVPFIKLRISAIDGEIGNLEHLRFRLRTIGQNRFREISMEAERIRNLLLQADLDRGAIAGIKGELKGLLGKPFLVEPDFVGVRNLIIRAEKAITDLQASMPLDTQQRLFSDTDKEIGQIVERLDLIKTIVDESRETANFMADYGAFLNQARLGKVSGFHDDEAVFNKVFRDWGQDSGLVRGSPRYWRARAYKTAFISERSAAFQACDTILLSIKVDDFRLLIQSLKKNNRTNILNTLLSYLHQDPAITCARKILPEGRDGFLRKMVEAVCEDFKLDEKAPRDIGKLYRAFQIPAQAASIVIGVVPADGETVSDIEKAIMGIEEKARIGGIKIIALEASDVEAVEMEIKLRGAYAGQIIEGVKREELGRAIQLAVRAIEERDKQDFLGNPSVLNKETEEGIKGDLEALEKDMEDIIGKIAARFKVIRSMTDSLGMYEFEFDRLAGEHAIEMPEETMAALTKLEKQKKTKVVSVLARDLVELRMYANEHRRARDAYEKERGKGAYPIKLNIRLGGDLVRDGKIREDNLGVALERMGADDVISVNDVILGPMESIFDIYVKLNNRYGKERVLDAKDIAIGDVREDLISTEGANELLKSMLFVRMENGIASQLYPVIVGLIANNNNVPYWLREKVKTLTRPIEKWLYFIFAPIKPVDLREIKDRIKRYEELLAAA